MAMRWAILGVGTAGRARARAICEDPESELVCAWRGRYLPDLGVPEARSEADAIAAADTVAICSPTEVHPVQIRAALAQDRDVVVEFPMASDAATAAELFALARQRGRLLHEEHIELMGGAAAALRSLEPGDVRRVLVEFTAIGQPATPGSTLALRNVARLHRLADCCGGVAAVVAVERRPGLLEALLHLTSGAEARLRFQVGFGLPRQTRLTLETRSGRFEQIDQRVWRDGQELTLEEPPSLFAADHALAMDRLRGGAPRVSEARIVHLLSVVDMLRAGRIGRVPWPDEERHTPDIPTQRENTQASRGEVHEDAADPSTS